MGDQEAPQLGPDEFTMDAFIASAETDCEKVRCSTCRELILRGAKKCTHCDSFQDWRRHLPASTSLLALTVSLLAGITAASPLVYQAYRRSDSDLRIGSAPVFQNGHVYVLVTNSGKKPGTVEQLKATLNIKDSNKVIYLHLIRPAQDINAGVVPGDSSKQMDFAAWYPATQLIDGAWNPQGMSKEELKSQSHELATGKCELRVFVTSFQGKSDEPKMSPAPDCWHFQSLIDQYWIDANPNIAK